MKVSPLFSNEMIGSGFTHKVEFDYTDLAYTAGVLDANATTKTFKLGGIMPAAQVVSRFALKVITAGVGTSTLTAQLGDSGVSDRFITAALGLLMAAAGTLADINPATAPAEIQGTKILQLLVTGNTYLNLVTAGSWVIYLAISDLNRL